MEKPCRCGRKTRSRFFMTMRVIMIIKCNAIKQCAEMSGRGAVALGAGRRRVELYRAGKGRFPGAFVQKRGAEAPVNCALFEEKTSVFVSVN